MKEHLPWIVPLILVILAAGGRLYTVVGEVDEIRVIQHKSVSESRERIMSLENRMTIVEKYCCEGEIK